MRNRGRFSPLINKYHCWRKKWFPFISYPKSGSEIHHREKVRIIPFWEVNTGSVVMLFSTLSNAKIALDFSLSDGVILNGPRPTKKPIILIITEKKSECQRTEHLGLIPLRVSVTLKHHCQLLTNLNVYEKKKIESTAHRNTIIYCEHVTQPQPSNHVVNLSLSSMRRSYEFHHFFAFASSQSQRTQFLVFVHLDDHRGRCRLGEFVIRVSFVLNDENV